MLWNNKVNFRLKELDDLHFVDLRLYPCILTRALWVPLHPLGTLYPLDMLVQCKSTVEMAEILRV